MIESNFERISIIILLIIIIFIGLVGNITNMFILSRRSMIKMSTFRFLLFLSLIDMLVILVCTVDALISFGFNFEIRLTSNFICRFHTFLTYYLTHMSSTVLMVVSIERVTIVCKQTIKIFFTKTLVFSFQKKIGKNNRKSCFDGCVREENQIKHKKEPFSLLKSNRIKCIIISISISLILIDIYYLMFAQLMTFKIEEEPNTFNNNTKNASLINFENESINEAVRDKNDAILKLVFLNYPYVDINDNKAFNFSSYELDETELSLESNLFITKDFKPAILNYEDSQDNQTYITLMLCTLSDEANYLKNKTFWLWVDISLYCLIPFVIMVVSTLLIYLEINLSTNSLNNSLNRNKINKQLSQRRNFKNKQMFIM